jgi:hypothetical protein
VAQPSRERLDLSELWQVMSCSAHVMLSEGSRMAGLCGCRFNVRLAERSIWQRGQRIAMLDSSLRATKKKPRRPSSFGAPCSKFFHPSESAKIAA